jgi:DNA-binding PadR family transcriptional regulator
MYVEGKIADWLKETQKGYIRIAVLILLDKKPHHGYDLMKALDKRTNGFWKPTAGGMYPILHDLEKFECIKGEWDLGAKRVRKNYVITLEGKRVLEHIMSKENRLAITMHELLKEYMKDMLSGKVDKDGQLLRSPFTRFIEENKCSPEDTKNVLENKRVHIEFIIKKLQENLEQIESQLTKIES